MRVISKISDVVTSCGNVLRGTVEVDREYCIEVDPDQGWVNIIDYSGRCETCNSYDGDVVAEGGECVTSGWSDTDWSDLKALLPPHQGVTEMMNAGG